ncbi:hypothetical protein BKA64DRAFT_766960 [Cadophora sp. MPI-SDFR-AT-0126]|nr:hypothetical protein BKA64DRAFT_766960 [Leotiomycetes sp. MPI-SDFR-AT-0126]
MFDLPDAKRIRRADLNRSGSSTPSSSRSASLSNITGNGPSADNEARIALLQAKLAALLGPVEFDSPVEQQLKTRDGSDNGKADKEDRRAKDVIKREKRRPKANEDVSMKADTDHTSNQESDTDTDIDTGSTSSPTNPNPDAEPSKQNQEEEQEYDFLLFRPPPTTSTSHQTQLQPQKIILSTTDELSGTGRILRPRPREFYISPKAAGDRKAQLESVAVTGDDILAERGRRHWGLEVPWRVRVLRPDGTLLISKGRYIAGETKPSPNSHGTGPSSQGPTLDLNIPLIPPLSSNPNSSIHSSSPHSKSKIKTKPNKKRRIILREKKRKREAAEAARKKDRESKEEAEREKRTRRNREKKVKRRLKEKAKKLEGEAGGGGDGEGGEGGDEEVA